MKKIIPLVAALSMTAAGVAMAQSTAPAPTAPSKSPSAESPSTVTPSATPRAADPTPGTPARAGDVVLTDTDAKKWIGKTVYSSDGQNLGEVAALQRDSSGKVTEMHADIGGFLGIGETRVKVMPGQFKMGADRVDLMVTGEQAKTLPKLQK